jgi:hypothetical protein
VISWNSLSLTFLSLDILFWWCHFLLIRFAPNISKSWQLLLLRAALITSLLSSCPESLHFPGLFTSLLSSRPHSLHFSTLFTLPPVPTLCTSLFLHFSFPKSLHFRGLFISMLCSLS